MGAFQGISHKFDPWKRRGFNSNQSQNILYVCKCAYTEEFTVTVSDLHYREGSDLHYREEALSDLHYREERWQGDHLSLPRPQHITQV